MWILPPSIMSAFAQDTEESTSVSPEQWAEACAQSLIARSKPSPVGTWSLRWKRDGWTRHLSGVISRRSLGKSFTAWWTSSLAATRASHSQLRASEPERTTLATFGLGSQTELELPGLDSASLRTSKDTLPSGSATSSKTWGEWVTERRGAYSARKRLVRAINESVYSSLPTPCANEDSFRLNGNSQQSKTLEAMARRGELRTAGSALGVTKMSLVAAGAAMENLNVLNAESGHIRFITSSPEMGAATVEKDSPNGQTTHNGPLNPAFVEVMMGLPVGWTDCDSSETE